MAASTGAPDAAGQEEAATRLQQRLQLQQQLLQQRVDERMQQPAPLRRSPSEAFLFRGLLYVKIVLGFVVGALLLLAITHLDATARLVKDLISGVQHLGSLAPLAYIGLYVLLIALFMPAEFMHLAAGFIFSRIYGEGPGIVVAFLCSLCGALLSGLCCFLISRHLLYDSLHAWMGSSRLFRAFDSAVEEGGLTFVALIRLSPILPYSRSLPLLTGWFLPRGAGSSRRLLTSYLFGVTALKASDLLLGTFSGTPLILIFNFIGSALSDLKDIDIRDFSWTWQRIGLVLLGVLMATASMVYITRLTRRKLEAAYASSLQDPAQRAQLLLDAAPGGGSLA
ncbi:hypothetical protein Emed_000638 [Eimeria media]